MPMIDGARLEEIDEAQRLRARVAELEARCAAMAEALEPLAALTIWADNVVSTGIWPCHILAARAALKGEG